MRKALKILEAEHTLHPLRQSALKSELFERIAHAEQQVAIPSHQSWVFLFAKPLPITLAIVVCVLISGGAALATENSLPGDFLHPLKLVAEKFETKLAISQESKAELEAKHTATRIDELSVLQNKIETETRSEIKADFEARRQLAENEAQARLENTLSRLETIREDLSTNGDDRAAQAVDTAIEHLKNRAVESKFKFKFRTKNNSTIHVDDNDSTDKAQTEEINKNKDDSVGAPVIELDRIDSTETEVDLKEEHKKSEGIEVRSRQRN